MKETSERKQKVLQILYETEADYVSGEELSNKLDVSRTTIWKYIQSLREQGYLIDSSSRLGYSLVKAPDILSPEEIKKDLETEILGQEVIYYEKVESTNKIAIAEAKEGAVEGAIVIAGEQTAGKGRLGRSFFCPPGGIWFSVILRPNLRPDFVAQLNFIGVIALAKTIDKLTDLKPGIKWPNDILVNGRKVSGILTELSAEVDQINYLVMGIGINLNIDLDQFPADLVNKASSVQRELGERVSKLEFFLSLITELELAYFKFQEQGFISIIEDWKEYNLTLGQEVQVDNGREVLVGKAVDIDSTGALLIKLADGRVKKVVAGDVTLEKEYT
ncbi:biotin--[acetyl-CoA-carboxylase] ligase [Fuchsiella alkaliacetigena]|uniref:biotin--[acetyl-CoA-carboxylase] ligase n=1 Tax=Fuchsiella alkaliacetigena TaxID=957042 RepID=UPI00200AD510|nr:biotin--[acetyl-CoA-carboxylase] ligase [Fuchsiella alkaliacetigena]MCK8824891.1 biotin--[acetyl-CoA-carboxylase] ligase [Fuchsiella alkaliacetigena]